MSLNWKWDKRMGSCTYGNGFTSTIYEGNATMIALAETDTTYNLSWFAADMDHLKNMLGLSKGYEGCLEENNKFFGIETLRLNTAYKSVPKIIEAFAKAKVNIKIELFYDEKKEKIE